MRVLTALRQLPTEITALSIQLRQYSALIHEHSALIRELHLALTQREAETPTPDLQAIADSVTASSTTSLTGAAQQAASHPIAQPLVAVPDARAKDPKRIRTAADVSYSSRSFLREQDDHHAGGRRPS